MLTLFSAEIACPPREPRTPLPVESADGNPQPLPLPVWRSSGPRAGVFPLTDRCWERVAQERETLDIPWRADRLRRAAAGALIFLGFALLFGVGAYWL